MNVTIKQHQKIRECVDLTNYDLEILVDGKPTNICIEASSCGGQVEAHICFIPRGYMWEGMEEMVLSRAKYVQVDGDIRHLKKHILENIEDILGFVFEDVIVLQAKVNEAYDLLKNFLDGKVKKPYNPGAGGC